MIDQDQLKRIAKEIFWWQQPEVSLANPRRFLAQVMTLGTWEQVKAIRQAFSPEAFRDALLNAETGWFDRPSWNYWLSVLGLAAPEKSEAFFTESRLKRKCKGGLVTAEMISTLAVH